MSAAAVVTKVRLVTTSGRFAGVSTRVQLADGYETSFIGTLGKREAVRQATALRARERARACQCVGTGFFCGYHGAGGACGCAGIDCPCAHGGAS